MSSNPFEAQLHTLETIFFSGGSPIILKTLIVIAVWRALAMLSCVACVIIPFSRGSVSRERHSWIFRRHYLQGNNKIPYIVPNRSMILSICEFFSNAISKVFLKLPIGSFENLHESQYLSGHDPFSLARVTTIWYGVAGIPSYLGIWLAAWGLFYSCICDVKGKRRGKLARIFSPIVYNTIWMSWPILVTSFMTFWAIAVGQAEKDVMDLSKSVYNLLLDASKFWNDPKSLPNSPMGELLVKGQLVIVKVDLLASRFRLWGCVWIFLACLLAIFYVWTAFYLLGMIRSMMVMREQEKLTGPKHFTTLIVSELEKEFRWLIVSCLIISLTLILDIMAAIVFVFYSWHITSPSKTWELATVIMCQIPGLVMSPAVLFPSWRILTGRNAADEARFHEAIMKNSNTEYTPDLSSLLLGWDTTINWSETESEENFPGLCMIETQNFQNHMNFFSSISEVNVTRSVVTCLEVKNPI
ncbi:hypothetical protein DFH28DRAFT_1160691 [Melampsora americana]|nr:hypothetical protein DFH28DRAFT_1126085 [Melampsora americana]KAH9816119.1 hypothetical protein DFH28DRAFT_1160691 [Melampsora americana]